MKIASSIADLLFEHECVVIPGLGGFITKTNPASVHPVKHQFKPPHKEIVFNQHLRANDGMLLNHIAHKESLPYSEAKKKMDKFVLRCLQEMQAGRRINFRLIGSISMDDKQQIVFDPDLSQNYLAESFGLTGFVSPAIKRETFTQKLEQQIKQQREEKSQKISSDTPKRKTTPKAPKQKVFRASRKKNPYKKQLIFIAVLLTFMASGWAYMNKHVVQHYYQTYASLVPFFYPSPNEYMATHMNHFGITALADNSDPSTIDKAKDLRSEIPVETLPNTAVLPETKTEEKVPTETEVVKEQLETPTAVQEEFIPAETITEATAKPAAEPTKELIQDPVQNMDQLKYFIIAGAFREKANADKLMAELRAKGFNAVFAGQTGSGLHRIAFEGHSSRSTALSRLEAIKEEENENAWLFSM